MIPATRTADRGNVSDARHGPAWYLRRWTGPAPRRLLHHECDDSRHSPTEHRSPRPCATAGSALGTAYRFLIEMPKRPNTTEQKEQEPAPQSHGSPNGVAHGIAIDERPEQHDQDHAERQNPGGERLERPMHVLEQFIIEEEIPFRARARSSYRTGRPCPSAATGILIRQRRRRCANTAAITTASM
jgi:hypothetical protein